MKTQIIDNDKDLLLLKNFLRSKNIFAFDTETDGLSHDRKMIGFSLAVEHNGNVFGFYVPCKHTQGYDLFSVPANNCNHSLVLEVLSDVFTNPSNTVWIHNAKFANRLVCPGSFNEWKSRNH